MSKLMIWRRFLMRGESAVASTGLALAAILLFAMAGSAWLMLRTHRASLHHEQAQSIESLATTLSQSSELLLAADELTALRRLITDTAQQAGLKDCRIILGDGQVLADKDPARISASELPASWPNVLADDVGVNAPNALSRRHVVTVAGRGQAILEVGVEPLAAKEAAFEAQTGAGALGAACLVALLAVYRSMRRRFRGIGAVRDALMAMAAGEADAQALVVSEQFGDEAAAWNRIIAERENIARDAATDSSNRADDRRTDAAGDLEGLCDAMWQGLIMVDDRMQIKYSNGAASLLLQNRREDMPGAQLSKVIADEHVLELVKAIVSGSVRQRSSVELERDNEAGHSVLRFNVRPVRRADSAAAMIVIEDITQQRLAEDARNSFVAQATHELRMPLTNIRLYAESAIDEGEDDPLMRAKCLNVINQESRRLERIVGDMLSVTEIEAGTLKLRHGDVRLDQLFDELRCDYQAQADEKKLELRFMLPPKLPVVQGDRDKLALTLHNLVGNALKYTPAGGAVTIAVDAGNGRLTVDVADTGLGIGEDEQERIFEKFYRAKDSRLADIPGSGLGLALAREVMRMHGGDITVKSQLNEGSTFTLTLPNLAEAA